VDDQVKAIVAALRANGELKNTYIFFTSDNGFLLGEHRQRRKNKPYEPTLRVPLLVRGPDLPGGTVRNATYSLVDLAPTFLELSGAQAQRKLDGRSMLATLATGAPGYRYYLIQGGTPAGPWWWRGVRSRNWVYVRYHHGFEELYDRAADPGQLRNVARDDSYRQVRAHMARRLADLRGCAGKGCRGGGSGAPDRHGPRESGPRTPAW
jgi:arylsulfatase A-like enzyme